MSDLLSYIRTLPCTVCHRYGCEPHHVKTRGSGGKDWNPDGSGNLVPLCPGHHREIHTIGRLTFAEKYKLDLPAKAKKYGEWLETEEMGF